MCDFKIKIGSPGGKLWGNLKLTQFSIGADGCSWDMQMGNQLDTKVDMVYGNTPMQSKCNLDVKITSGTELSDEANFDTI